MSKSDITNKLERLSAFEERWGVTLSGLSVFFEIQDPEYYDDDEITILGELKAQTGTEISEDIELVVAVYDNEERVIGTSSSTFYADDFFTLETFEMNVSIPKHLNILKVRIYPKKS